MKKTGNQYCVSFGHRERFVSREVKIGEVALGGENPIRVQSMTTVDTMDTEGSIEESIRMIDAGCEIVRLTAPSKKEAENLKLIKEGLVERGYSTPLVADIHFTPNAAEIAADYVEKIRVNPGNYADKKKFESLDFTDDSYQKELDRIEEKFTPLVIKCKSLGRSMRIGTNHGSLSDRILSRFGDTPEGMVESAFEFIRICRKNDYHDLVISMKASNTLVMVQAYRLLVARMMEEGWNYPLHLGVTEAGDGEDGRIKSAVGIGALLEDGLGDTVRVSLTENPEYEIPVAQKLIAKYKQNEVKDVFHIDATELTYSPYQYHKRDSKDILNIGHQNHPVVFGDLSQRTAISPASFYPYGYNYSVPLDKWNINDLAADYIFLGDNTIDFEIPGTLRLVLNYSTWNILDNKQNYLPFVKMSELDSLGQNEVFFIEIADYDEEALIKVSAYPNAILVFDGQSRINKTVFYRRIRLFFDKNKILNPVVLRGTYSTSDEETFQLESSAEFGIQFIDGFGDGIWIQSNLPAQLICSTSFGILQATRTRISKTEYISCPSCGRTLFDLQETTAKIRQHTSHLKGVKIGIMGCIVNGPGEMADADYGYVGTGPGKINLYKEQTVVERNVPEEEAVQALINLIKSHGDWVEPTN